MNSSLNSLHHYPPINHRYPSLPRPNLHRTTPTCSLRRRRHFRRRRNTTDFTTTTTDANTYPPDPDSKLHMVINLDNYISTNSPVSINNLLKSFKFDLNEFIESGNVAVLDLQTLITVDSDKRVVVSCRKSTVYFMGKLVVLSLVSFVIFKVLNSLRLGFGSLLRKRGGVGGEVVTRRDRSLGGREVVVSTTKKDFRNEGSVNVNPLSSIEELRDPVSTNWEKSNKKLPDWWPDTRAAPLEGVLDKEESQRKANSLIRAILDYRTSGKDLQEDDIVLLRQICRMSGVKVSIENSNSRDSIYPTSVDFILNTCARVASHSTFVQIDGEDAPEFIAGLADNIGLESFCAARMVTAAVAARTRSWLLQAWALEMQGKPIEAVTELSKLCLVHRIFPPIENSVSCLPSRRTTSRLRTELTWITKSNGTTCFMLSPDTFSGLTCWFKSAPASPNESRFGKVLFKENAHDISMMFKLIYPLLSTKTTYACYLVYKMQNDPCFEQPWDVTVYCHHMKKEDMHLDIPVSDRRPFCVYQSKKTKKIFLRRPQPTS